MSKSGEMESKYAYSDQLKLDTKPLSSEEKENNSANVIKGARLGLGEALGDLLGGLGEEEKKLG